MDAVDDIDMGFTTAVPCLLMCFGTSERVVEREHCPVKLATICVPLFRARAGLGIFGVCAENDKTPTLPTLVPCSVNNLDGPKYLKPGSG
jgi:hypothetical protein